MWCRHIEKRTVECCSRVSHLFPKVHVLEYIFYCLRTKGLSSQFSTSYEALLDRLGHGYGSNVILLGGRPGIGKSRFAAYLAERLTRISGMSVAIFVQDEGDKLAFAKWKNVKSSILSESTEVGSQGSVMLYEEPNVSIDVIKERLAVAPADFVILDLLQCMGNYTKGKGLEEKVAFMSGVQNLADEKNIPVLVTSGLKRDVDRRKRHRPKVRDFHQASDIIHYADVALLLYREGYYDDKADQSNAVCLIAEQFGILEEIPLLWNRKNGRFEDVCCGVSVLFGDHLTPNDITSEEDFS